ncbi:putative Protein FAM92A1 [Hypsibius exemplaris]|uniref:Protein FAM92A1 n=1 Tax=Hypsibius exemplaris TaxID=2072580 RepID=A0A9X6RMZ8_HYPEX|nr:putative Protein FAM92A1 [Hypsibius exemplaris]
MDVWYPPLFETSSLEYQAKLILARAENTELKFGNFCRNFALYSRHVASVRDVGDELTNQLIKFCETQKDAPITQAKLEEFIGLFNSIIDQEHARVKRLQSKVVAGFSKYGFLCRAIKDEIKRSLGIKEREHQQAEEFAKLQAKFVGNFHLHQQRQDELHTAISDTRRAQELLKKESDKFERQKVSDTQQILMNFCEIELAYHARLIEICTAAYNVVKDVGPDTDMDNFRKSLAGKFEEKIKVGLDHVPVHVPSTQQMPVVVGTGFTTTKPAKGPTSSTDERDTDTKEFAETTAENDTQEELISEVAYYVTPTDDEGGVSTEPERRTMATVTRKASRKLKVSIADVVMGRTDGKRKDARSPSKSVVNVMVAAEAAPTNQPLTPAQIRRYSTHFGVPAVEYTTDSDHKVGNNSLGGQSSPM